MNLDFTTEQNMLRDAAAKFFAGECNFETVKHIEDSELGYLPELWQKIADLGWLGLPFPSDYGGYDGTFLDLVILQEEIGKAVFPSPFFSTVVQCGLLILEGGTEAQKKDLLGRITEGKLIMAMAQYEEETDYTAESIGMTAEPNGTDYRLNGTKNFVMDANIAHKLIVAAKVAGSGIGLFMVDARNPGIQVIKVPTVSKDNTCLVRFKDVPAAQADMIGNPGDGAALLRKMYAKAAVAKAGEIIGGSKACIGITADYAKKREQYGNPIGGYQAVQHFMANMLLGYDTANSYLYRVACMVDAGEDFARDASALKAAANENFLYTTEKGVKIHGGIGTTREADIALFYRRAHTYAMMCGDTSYHYDRIAESLLTQGLASF